MYSRKKTKTASINSPKSSRSEEAQSQSNLKNSKPSRLFLTGDRNAPDIKNKPGLAPTKDAIKIELNQTWVNKDTRSKQKYSPVKVIANKNLESMKKVIDKRIATCKKLAYQNDSDSAGWISFRKRDGTQEHTWQEHDLQSEEVPIIVISGGSANKIASDLKNKTGSLAWHPKYMRGEPVYLLVHEKDFKHYEATLSEIMEEYKNLQLIGWHGGNLSGFGAARAAALAFADTLPYRPQQIMMMDQDVALTEDTRHTNPKIKTQLNNKHKETKKSIVGLGVGFPTRELPPKHFGHKKTGTQEKQKTDKRRPVRSPVQQYVSIKAPFRRKGEDGLYAPYMVAGGEDMLMGLQAGLTSREEGNIALLEGKIVKKELTGPEDTPNDYWKKTRPGTLEKIFDKEKDTQFELGNEIMSLDELMNFFAKEKYIEKHPSPESHNVAACIIERVILKYNEKKHFNNQPNAIFNTQKSALEAATSFEVPAKAAMPSGPLASPLSPLQKSERLRVSRRPRYFSI
jgi:hypothetical protein